MKQFIQFTSLSKLMLLLLFLLIAAPVSKAETLEASIFDIAPWGYLDENGKVAGIEYDVIKAIAKEMNEDIKIKLVPYKRMIIDVQTGVSDFAIFYRSKKSEAVAEPIVPWGKLDIAVIGKKGTIIKTYDDLYGKMIGVRLGGYFDPKFDADQKLKKIDVENYAHGIRLLRANRLDAVIGTAATLYYELKKQGVAYEELEKPFIITSTADWLHFSRKSKRVEKKERLVQAVNKLVKNGTFERLFASYLPYKWHHQR